MPNQKPIPPSPIPEEVDVAAIRKKLRLTQTNFASVFGFSYTAVRDWEQRRTKPDRSARAYLTIIDQMPDIIAKALNGDGPRAHAHAGASRNS